MADLSHEIIELATVVQTAGGRAMLVGGCVRDELMGIPAKDWDLEIYGVEPERLRKILDELAARIGEDLNVVGEAFTVYKIGSDLDVSLPRREKKVGSSFL